MSRGPDTLFAKIELTPAIPGVARVNTQAKERGETLGTYLKHLILALLKEGPYVLLRYKASSRVLMHLEQEARTMEMPVDEYIKALLTDRDRELYGGEKSVQPAHLWYAQGHSLTPCITQEVQTQDDDLDLEEAFSNVDAFLSMDM